MFNASLNGAKLAVNPSEANLLPHTTVMENVPFATYVWVPTILSLTVIDGKYPYRETESRNVMGDMNSAIQISLWLATLASIFSGKLVSSAKLTLVMRHGPISSYSLPIE